MKKSKIPILFLFLVPLFCSFSMPKEMQRDFESGMGKDTSAWGFIQTGEDFARLNFFKQLYEKNNLISDATGHQIPKTLHFIWLGPDAFPLSSVENVKQWMRRHPHWEVKFWSDVEKTASCEVLCEVPCPGMVVKRFEEFPLAQIKTLYFQSDNFGEKAELLRYAILLDEGGLCVDHDTFPVQSFDALQENYSFYCGLETPAASILSSSIFPSTHLIASKAHHPVMQHAIDWLIEEWHMLEEAYPVSDRASLINRVKHRSFSALGEGIKRGIDRAENRDIVFPASCFSLPKVEKAGKWSTWSIHTHAATWNKKESVWEKKIFSQIDTMQKQEQRTEILVYALLSLNVLICLWLVPKWKKGILLLVFLPSFIFASADFEQLMGKNTSHWDHLVQPLDKQELDRYKTLYDKNKSLLLAHSAGKKIPSVIHFIWLGPRPFPPQSVENVRTWMAIHPDWTVKFWTDRNRPPPCVGMEVHDVRDFSFSFLKNCYESSENYGEKSDILRFEILYREGGVYADHDANCLHPFEQLHAGFDFYCCLETPHPPFVGRNLTSGNGVIGSRPGHPTIAAVIDLISKRWDELGKRYAGKDTHSRTQLVMERTYIALTDALVNTVDREGNVDIVLPSSYFFAKSGIASLYSKHFYATAWADSAAEKNPLEKELHREIGKLKHKHKHTEKALWVIVALNALIVILMYKRFRKYRSLHEEKLNTKAQRHQDAKEGRNG